MNTVRVLAIASLATGLAQFAIGAGTAQGAGTAPGAGARAAPPARSPARGPMHGDPAHDDLSGHWQVVSSVLRAEQAAHPPALQGEYRALLEKRVASAKAGKVYADQTATCQWNGMPRAMTQPFPLEIVQTPGLLLILGEHVSEFRHVYTDGRGHPADPEFTYEGHSTGRWDGSTLVVDTVALKDRPWMDFNGAAHSDKLRITERLRRVSADELEDAFVLDDAAAFSKPWQFTLRYRRLKDFEWIENVCTEANTVRVDDEGFVMVEP